MSKVTVNFFRCLQGAQELGSDDEFMISRLFFNIVTPQKSFDDLHVDIKQVAGSKYNRDEIEVGAPKIRELNIDYAEFSEAATDYYFGLFSSGPNIKNMRMMNNNFYNQKSYEISVLTKDAGW